MPNIDLNTPMYKEICNKKTTIYMDMEITYNLKYV